MAVASTGDAGVSVWDVRRPRGGQGAPYGQVADSELRFASVETLSKRF